MSNAIVNPLLDSCLTQLTAIRHILGERSEVHAVDAAKSQLVSIKQMLSADDVPLLPQARPDQTRLGLNDGDYVEGDGSQQVIDLKGVVTRRVDKPAGKIGKAIIKTLKREGCPLTSKFIFDRVIKEWRKYGLALQPSTSQVKTTLRSLHGEGLVIKTGDRNGTRYSMPK